MSGMIAVREYKSVAEMRAAYVARSAAIYGPRSAPVMAVKPTQIIEMIERWRDTHLVQQNEHVKARASWLSDDGAQLKAALEAAVAMTLDETPTAFFAAALIRVSSNLYGVSANDITSARRTRDIVLPRHKMIWLVKKITPLSYPRIGRAFGGRDHTTTIFAVRKIEAMLVANDPRVAELRGYFDD